MKAVQFGVNSNKEAQHKEDVKVNIAEAIKDLSAVYDEIYSLKNTLFNTSDQKEQEAYLNNSSAGMLSLLADALTKLYDIIEEKE